MENTNKIIENIRKAAAGAIVSDILINGVSRVYNPKVCIAKVKNTLGIELKENENGFLVFA